MLMPFGRLPNPENGSWNNGRNYYAGSSCMMQLLAEACCAGVAVIAACMLRILYG